MAATEKQRCRNGAVAARELLRALRQRAADGPNSRAQQLTHHARTVTVVLEFAGTMRDVARVCWVRLPSELSAHTSMP